MRDIRYVLPRFFGYDPSNTIGVRIFGCQISLGLGSGLGSGSGFIFHSLWLGEVRVRVIRHYGLRLRL